MDFVQVLRLVQRVALVFDRGAGLALAAVVQHEHKREENVPMPVADDRDVLIKVKKTGICGTDLHIFNWGPKFCCIAVP